MHTAKSLIGGFRRSELFKTDKHRYLSVFIGVYLWF